MNKEIQSQLDRARELKKELDESSNSDLKSHMISDKTRNLTQEILVKIRSILDQALYHFFEKEIAPNLNEKDKKNAKVYFPLVSKLNDLKSSLGRAKMKDLDLTHPRMFSFLESVQPYHKNYIWLNELSKYANEKHIRLTPQKRVEVKRITVSRGKGSVSWGPGVRFGSGISVMGAPVNPLTQNIEPTPGVESKTETWVSFMFEDSDVNVIALCSKSIEESERIINDFFSLF